MYKQKKFIHFLQLYNLLKNRNITKILQKYYKNITEILSFYYNFAKTIDKL